MECFSIANHSEIRIGNLHKYQDAERIMKEMTGH
jgi:hypothetical protein